MAILTLYTPSDETSYHYTPGFRELAIDGGRMTRAYLRICAFSLALALCGASAWAGDSLPARDLKGLLGAQRQLYFSVSDYKDAQGKAWIRVSGGYEGAYRARMEDVIATLWDFKGAPQTFPRIEATRVRSDDGRVAEIEQRTGVHVLGFSYITNLVFRDILRRGDKTAVIDFESIEVDGSVLSTKGTWSLEDRSDAAGCATYVRYTLESFVAPRYPAQAVIMRQFGGEDIRALIQQLGEATARRVKKG